MSQPARQGSSSLGPQVLERPNSRARAFPSCLVSAKNAVGTLALPPLGPRGSCQGDALQDTCGSDLSILTVF